MRFPALNIAKHKNRILVSFLVLWLILPTFATIVIPGPWSASGRMWIMAFSFAQIALLFLPFRTIKQVFWCALPIAFVSPFYFFMTMKFNSPPGDAFMSASFHVNRAQLVETLILAGPKLLLLPFFWCLYIVAVRSLPDRQLSIEPKKKILAGVLFVILANVVGKNIEALTGKFETPIVADLLDTAYPSNFLRSTNRYLQHQETQDTVSIQGKCKDTSCPPIRVVFVLGESVRPDHLSLYGYKRQTTPFLDSIKNDIIVFDDAVATANWTLGAVPSIIFHEMPQGKASVVRTMKEAGFDTAWFSNEPRYLYGRDADQSVYAEDGFSFKYRKDTALLPYFHSFIKQAGQKQFVVLHTFGSHISYDSRYGDEAKLFKPTLTDIGVIDPLPRDKVATINSYDNTIVQLDLFLKDVIETVAKDSMPTVVVYESDHGEDLFDDERNRFMHAMTNPTSYSLRVPLFVWANPAYRNQYSSMLNDLKKNTGKSINHYNMMPTLLALGNVTTTAKLEQMSLTNPNLKEIDRLVRDSLGKEPLNFKNIR